MSFAGAFFNRLLWFTLLPGSVHASSCNIADTSLAVLFVLPQAAFGGALWPPALQGMVR